MRIQTIFTMPSPYRDDFRIRAYTFGTGRKTLCIVGSMRGDELQQQYVASQLVARLKTAEAEGRIPVGVSISVVPSANPFSINIEKRFWALDNTDINRMFPGYNLGETTQRIAAGLFEFIKDFRYGIQLASYYLPGNFIPHVRVIRTGFEHLDDAQLFGFPYVSVKDPEPFDTVLLNYNWQIWETQAFSLYAGTTDVIDHAMARQSIEGIGRFMTAKCLLAPAASDATSASSASSPFEVTSPSESTAASSAADASASGQTAGPGLSRIIDEADCVTVQSPHAGILEVMHSAGDSVTQGQTIARIIHPYEGHTVCEIKSPITGTILFARNKSITFQNTILFRII